MKKTIKLIGFIVIIAVIGFTMMACGGEPEMKEEPLDNILKISGLQKTYEYMDTYYDPVTEEYKDKMSTGVYTYVVYVFRQDITVDEIRPFCKYNSNENPDGYEYGIEYEWVKEGKLFTQSSSGVEGGVASFTFLETVIDKKRIEEEMGKGSYVPGMTMTSSSYPFNKSGDFSVLLYYFGSGIENGYYHAVIKFNEGSASVDISAFTEFNLE